MSKGDISIKETGGRNSVPTDRWNVAAGALTLIEAGEPAKMTGTADGTAILLEDADLTIATDQPMLGIAASDSTDTVAAVGYSDQYVPLPDIKWECKVKTAALANTQALIDAMLGDLYLIDLASSTAFTIDTAAATAATAAFLIVGGDPNRSTLWFRIRPDACAYGRASV